MKGISEKIILDTAIRGTTIFFILVIGSVFFEGSIRTASLIVNLFLFAAGCYAFMAAFIRAVKRSRTEVIGVGGLYFLSGCAPSKIRRQMMGLLFFQVVVSLTAASLRPFTIVASAVLVPVFGLGFSGLWAANHGDFEPR